MRKYLKLFLIVILLVSFIPINVNAEEKPDVELWNVLKPLETTVTFLNTGAHPDDERSDLLAYLSRGLGVQTASLIANRGEGGQNEIGNELYNGLGIIRSREMIEASKITGVKAYHLSDTTSDPIYDFGFSKTPEETLENWGDELTYERFIRFIRTYKPDIIMPSFRNVDTQHGHHRAITILSEKAFKDAADPNVFPQHLKEGLTTWQIKKHYLPGTEQNATTSFEIGMYDPIYEKSYPQLGEESRFMHKSQGMGNVIEIEPRTSYLELVNSAVDEKGSNDLFAGIPADFAEWAQYLSQNQNDVKTHLTKLQSELDSIVSTYPHRDKIYTKSIHTLKNIRNVISKVEKSKVDNALKMDLLHKLSIKEEQLQQVSFVSSELKVESNANQTVLTKGSTTSLTVTLKNEGKHTLKKLNVALEVPEKWKVSTVNETKSLSPGQSINLTYKVDVPEDAEDYHAYDESAVRVKVHYEDEGAEIQQYSEVNGTIAVLPDVSLTLSPEGIVVNTAGSIKDIPVKVKVKNYYAGKNEATISLNIPEGWKVSPQAVEVDFSEQLEEKEVSFQLTPPANIQDGKIDLSAKAVANGKTFNTTIQEISYDHIGDFYYEYPAAFNAVAFELLQKEGLKIGYIESGFDLVADSLTNVGMNIVKLSDADLATGDLSQYDTIVVGIRAHLSREVLKENNDRLLEYAHNGGHLVVQYHRPSDGWDALTTAPYPLTIGNPSIRWRVTDENAAVSVLKPDSSLFSYPNVITNADWDNWIQERGLYFPMDWDQNYETFVRMGDPNEAPFDGGILIAEYGEGTYAYTNLVFYRQIQGQVPGAYRIFTNLLSYER